MVFELLGGSCDIQVTFESGLIEELTEERPVLEVARQTEHLHGFRALGGGAFFKSVHPNSPPGSSGLFGLLANRRETLGIA